MPINYEICVEGHLDPSWSEWLEGMVITLLKPVKPCSPSSAAWLLSYDASRPKNSSHDKV